MFLRFIAAVIVMTQFTAVASELRAVASELRAVASELRAVASELRAVASEPITIKRKSADQRIRIDGRLDEPVWQSLPTYDNFVLVDPDTLEPGSHATLVRFTYDVRGLYVGVAMQQPDGTLIKRLSGRDQRALNRDSINITLDTSGTGLYGFWFGLALGDSLMDGTVLPERQFSSDWDGAWRGATAEMDNGWSAEFMIPWGHRFHAGSGRAATDRPVHVTQGGLPR